MAAVTGSIGGLTRHFNFGYDNGDVDRIKNMVHSGEGCRVPGFVWVNRVPGNIHLWTYSHAYLFSSLCQETPDINVSHHVDHVSFGTDTDISFVKEQFAGTGIVSPLDGVHQVVEQSTTTTTTPRTLRLYGSVGRGLGQASGGILEYYTKVVPTTYVPLYRDPLHVYQFTASSNKITSGQTPSIYLRFDFSPISVRYSEAREKLSHFLVQLCAVIGGIFTITGLFNSQLHESILHIAKKARVGKLG